MPVVVQAQEEEAAPTGWGAGEAVLKQGGTLGTAQGGRAQMAHGGDARRGQQALEEASGAASERGRRKGKGGRERRGSREERRGRQDRRGLAQAADSARQTQEQDVAEEQGAATGWGGDVAGAPGGWTGQVASLGAGNGSRGEWERKRGGGDEAHREGEPTGWADVAGEAREEPGASSWQQHPPEVRAARSDAGRQSEPGGAQLGGSDANLGAMGTAPSGAPQKARAKFEVQDVRVLEGALPAAALKRSVVNPAPLLTTPPAHLEPPREQARRSGVGVQDARFLPEEDEARAGRSSRKKKKRSDARKGRGSPRTPQRASPQGILDPKSTPGAREVGAEFSPSQVPPSGWKVGGRSAGSPASILEVGEQASPGERSSRFRNKSGQTGPRDQGADGQAGFERAEEAKKEGATDRVLARDTGGGTLGTSDRSGDSRTRRQGPGGDGEKSQGRSQHSAPSQCASDALDSAAVTSKDPSSSDRNPAREETHRLSKAGGVSDVKETAQGEAPDRSSQDAGRESNVSEMQRSSTGQSAKRVARPSGVWSVRSRYETSTSSI
jgi:hypothetical protein